MAEVTLPYNIQDGQKITASPVMANFGAITGVVNGGIDGTNVLVGTPSPQSSVGGLSAGSSAGLALADHQHTLQGWERLAGDPTSGNFVGRSYFDTTNSRTRLCIAVANDGTGTWVTSGNLAESDLPNHADRHAAGGPDALPSGSVDQTMLSRTLYSGQPSGDITVSKTTWTDVVTGVTPTVTGTQLCTAYANVGYNNTGSNVLTINWRIIDQNSNLLGSTKAQTVGASGSNNEQNTRTFVWPFTASASPTIKLQVYTSDTGISVIKTAAVSGGTATILQVVVG